MKINLGLHSKKVVTIFVLALPLISSFYFGLDSQQRRSKDGNVAVWENQEWERGDGGAMERHCGV